MISSWWTNLTNTLHHQNAAVASEYASSRPVPARPANCLAARPAVCLTTSSLDALRTCPHMIAIVCAVAVSGSELAATRSGRLQNWADSIEGVPGRSAEYGCTVQTYHETASRSNGRDYASAILQPCTGQHGTTRRTTHLGEYLMAKSLSQPPRKPTPINSNIAVEDAPPDIQGAIPPAFETPVGNGFPESAKPEEVKPPLSKNLTFYQTMNKIAKADWGPRANIYLYRVEPVIDRSEETTS